MPEDQDKANEACLTEFEHHDFATSESRTDFCCFTYKRGDSIDAVFLVKSESLEDSSEEIEYTSDFGPAEAVTYGAALLEYVAPETEEDEDDEDEDEEEAARVGAISLAAITASMVLYIQWDPLPWHWSDYLPYTIMFDLFILTLIDNDVAIINFILSIYS